MKEDPHTVCTAEWYLKIISVFPMMLYDAGVTRHEEFHKETRVGIAERYRAWEGLTQGVARGTHPRQRLVDSFRSCCQAKTKCRRERGLSTIGAIGV
jgi:hypothetical protein